MAAIRFATSNMFKRLNGEQSAKHVAKVTAQADVIVWQEVTTIHRRTLKRLDPSRWQSYFPNGLGGLAITWRTDKFRVLRDGRARRVVPGIKRIDPGRGFVDIILADRETGTVWPIIGTHVTHQAWTSHPERRPRWWAQARRLKLRSRRLARRRGRVLGGGDVNRHRWAPKGTVGAWPAGGTHGRSSYDVLWRRGRVDIVGSATEIHTPSDHDTAVATFVAT